EPNQIKTFLTREWRRLEKVGQLERLVSGQFLVAERLAKVFQSRLDLCYKSHSRLMLFYLCDFGAKFTPALDRPTEIVGRQHSLGVLKGSAYIRRHNGRYAA